MTTTTLDPATYVGVLSHQLAISRMAFQRNTAGITHAESLAQPSPGGNCLNWVAGHVVSTRQHIVRLLGLDPVWDEQRVQRYRRGAEPVIDDSDTAAFDDITAAFERSHDAILEGLQRVGPERLAEKAPFSPSSNPDETVGSLLASLFFHDSYHVGQTGMLRRLAGKEGAIR